MKDCFSGKIAILIRSQVLYSLFKISAKYSNKNGVDVNIFLTSSSALEWLHERRSEKRLEIIVS